ncbi:MAG: dihydropteroate synthase [Burkholderiales bacterium]|nr:dihydropteroate synthase [Opitutaceae bacterium]
MGILNVTDDSFSDGDRHATLDTALAHARRLVAEGADILDIGGQSTRPGYVEIATAEEIARTAPVLRALASEFPSLPLSIDTYQPAVAAAALEAGAHILNDIHGLQGPGGPALARLAAAHGAIVVVMHNDAALRDLPADTDPLPSVLSWLRRSVDIALAAGVPADRIILDPGIGFGKTQAQNLALLARLDALHALGFPLLLGVSRKSVIRHVLPELESPADRLEATLALTALAVRQGVQIHRVHDVQANRRAARMAAALRDAAA